jgi:hypothetical protein
VVAAIEKIDVAKTCRVCKEVKKLTVSKAGYENWKDGIFIQEALPELSADDRELLISGVCGKCFDEMFSEEG